MCALTELRKAGVLFTIFLSLITTVTVAAQDQERAASGDALSVQAVDVAIPRGTCKVLRGDAGDDVRLSDFGSLLVPGKPRLPSKIFSIAIPPQAEYAGLEFDLGEGVELPDTYDVAVSPLPRVIGEENSELYAERVKVLEANQKSVYGSDAVYPARNVEFVRTSGYRGYNLVDVRVTPFAYRPVSGKLVHYPDIKVSVLFRPDASKRAAVSDSSVRFERMAEQFVLNHEDAAKWLATPRNGEKGLHDFVIITIDSLTSSVTPIVNWETSRGRTVEIVTTSWISSNYGGGYDLAENIRNFLRDKYPSSEWGIEDVLIVGHYDDVPMRRTEQDVGHGKPETDFYYAELSLPDDQSWDSDGDHKYGEASDSIDYYPEVHVGRIPWSDAATVQAICQKTVAYQQNTDPTYKKNALLMGAFFWEDTDNAELMEAKIDQPWMSDWTFTRLYEQNSTVYSSFACDYELTHDNVRAVWPNGTYGFVNWAGHGSPQSSHMMGYATQAFIDSGDCALLNDNYPAIIFADSCSNSDTDYLNLGQAMIKQGAVAFWGATKVAHGAPGWSHVSHGSTQSLDYFFTTAVTSGQYTIGEAQHYALVQMYVNGMWDVPKYEVFEWGAIWGCPTLSMNAPSGIKVSPPEAFEADGDVGGPFSGNSQSYTIKNMSQGSVDYSVSSGTPWVTISNGTGTLSSFGDSAVVTVAINSAADSLAAGIYTATVDFANLTDHAGDTYRDIVLTVGNNDYCVYGFEACPGTLYTGTTFDATNDGASDCGESDASPDLWYKYTPAMDGTATFSLCEGTYYDSVLAVHSGCPGFSFNQLDCNDEYCDGASQVTIGVRAGRTYRIRVAGWNSSVGVYGLMITGPQCVSNVTCVDGDMDENEVVDGEDIQLFVNAVLAASTEAYDVCAGDFSGNGVVDTADVSGMVAELLGQ